MKLILQKYQRIIGQVRCKLAMPARAIHSRDLMHPDPSLPKEKTLRGDFDETGGGDISEGDRSTAITTADNLFWQQLEVRECQTGFGIPFSLW